jgi:alkyl hydroperoxide reductase subunit F
MYDLIIVGGGPAGLAAALYATRKRLNYLLISEDLGGKSNYDIALPESDHTQVIQARALVTEYRSRVEALRHSHKKATVTGVEQDGKRFLIKLASEETEEAHAVIIATGAGAKPLGVEGEKEFLGKGLGYSSISYSHLLAGRRVFLCGDQRALDSALELSLHADHVTVALTPETDADSALIDRVAGLDRVQLFRGAQILAFEGNGRAEKARIKADGEERSVAADAFFVETDSKPNTQLLEKLVKIERDGRLAIDSTNMTSVAGLFAAGDVTGTNYEQVLIALGDGVKAILSAYRYLISNNLLTARS